MGGLQILQWMLIAPNCSNIRKCFMLVVVELGYVGIYSVILSAFV